MDVIKEPVVKYFLYSISDLAQVFKSRLQLKVKQIVGHSSFLHHGRVSLQLVNIESMKFIRFLLHLGQFNCPDLLLWHLLYLLRLERVKVDVLVLCCRHLFLLLNFLLLFLPLLLSLQFLFLHLLLGLSLHSPLLLDLLVGRRLEVDLLEAVL